MNYHHIYHAGNFADVFKHLILCFCLEKLQEKEAPFLVLDTHAGIGKYDLSLEESKKTSEYKNGILKLFEEKNPDPIFNNYLKIIKKLNRLSNGELKIYPGSPIIAKQFLRAQDRAIFSELHPQDFILLKRCFAGNQQISTLNEDGYSQLKSKLPPLEKRALILIDPPFEKGHGKENDFILLSKYLIEGYKRFATGIYLVWYPIIDKKITNNFVAEIKSKIQNDKILVSEIIIDENKEGFKGCGMLIINAPWKLEEKLNHALPLLLKYFKKEKRESSG